MDERKWEDLNKDCLANVFGRVGLDSLILDVPFVCKSWYKASFDLNCWKSLDFNILNDFRGNYFWLYNFTESFIDKYHITNFSISKFIKMVVSRSRRSATCVKFPSKWTVEIMDYILEECPALRLLVFQSFPSKGKYDIQNLKFSNLKDMEELKLGNFRGYCLTDILTQISHHCNNFVSFGMSGYVSNEQASAIGTLIPKIKCLKLSGSTISKENLKVILNGCKELTYLDVSFCYGFDGSDPEILEMASHIKVFLSFMSPPGESDSDYDYDFDYDDSESDYE